MHYYYLNFVLTYFILSVGFFIFDIISYRKENWKILKIDKISLEDTLDLYIKISPIVSFNVIVVTFPVLLFIEMFYTNYNGLDPITIVTDLFLSRFLAHNFFYWCHRFFHQPNIYKFHKIHHELKTPVAMSAAYSHWIDYLYGNLITIGIPAIIVGLNPLLLNIFIIISLIETHITHSNIIYFKQHDTHHKYFKYNFGSTWLDITYNTIKNQHQE